MSEWVCMRVALRRAWGKLERLLLTSKFGSGCYTGRGRGQKITPV